MVGAGRWKLDEVSGMLVRGALCRDHSAYECLTHQCQSRLSWSTINDCVTPQGNAGTTTHPQQARWRKTAWQIISDSATDCQHRHTIKRQTLFSMSTVVCRMKYRVVQWAWLHCFPFQGVSATCRCGKHAALNCGLTDL